MHGRKLRARRQALLERLLPALRIDPAAIPSGDPRGCFPHPPGRVHVEIGFGAGERLASLAAAEPQTGFVGCEPFVNGVAALLAEIEARDLHNVRIFDDDARLLLPALAGASVERIDLPFPDPWPKRRHHRRRLVNAATIAEFARILADGGEFRFASDHPGYVAWTLEHVGRHCGFAWMARRPGDWQAPPAGEVMTRYAGKALARGDACYWLRFRRRPRGN